MLLTSLKIADDCSAMSTSVPLVYESPHFESAEMDVVSVSHVGHLLDMLMVNLLPLAASKTHRLVHDRFT